MSEKHVPVRTCVACRKAGDKREFIRVVKDKEGNFSVDLTGKSNGRGAYLCKNAACIAKAKKTKVLNRQFETPVPDEIYDELLKVAEEQN